MKRYEKKTETRTENVLVEHVCDFCGRDMDECENCYQVLDTTIVLREGEQYPEDGRFGETTEFDICTKCFKEKLMPWATSQGAKPTVTEWDY